MPAPEAYTGHLKVGHRNTYAYMSILLWIIFGALAGWIASLIMKTDAQQGALANIIIGIIGAFIGGWLFNMFGAAGTTGFNLWSLIVAVIGSIILIWIIRLVRR